ncbi:MAG: HD domain-containing protein, partial [Synergistaceae bacterium]|nr:HD domain-containing protein [Synergistaceae bacterium]
VIGGDVLAAAARILGEAPFISYARQIIEYHHEKWDGTGYPHGLKGEEIPFIARIMAIADVYDALVSERPYKGPIDHEKAVAIIVEGAGTHFDPVLVEAFLACADEFKSISQSGDTPVPGR